MKLSPTFLVATVCAAFALCPSALQADTYYYQTYASDSSGQSSVLWSTVPSPGSPWGGIELLAPSYGSASTSREIVIANLRAFSCAPSDNPERFVDSGYQLSLSILDLASGEFGMVTFTGLLNGTLSHETAKIDNTFTGTSTYTLRLGNNTYTITIGNYAPPGPPSSGLLGSITAHVALEQGIPTDTPEPSALVLGGLGCAFLGLASWRKRRGAASP